MKFFKMNGLGNDYIFIDNRLSKTSFSKDDIIYLSDRHFGIGGDGVVIIDYSDIAHLRMSIYNSDGSWAEMCGNALRCVGKYAYDRLKIEDPCISVETLAGVKQLYVAAENDIAKSIKANIGMPKISGKTEIKCNDKVYEFYLVDVGNPHAVTFDTDFDIGKYGDFVSNYCLFPNRINVEKVGIISNNSIRVEVFERGAGRTLACGTGAAASAFVAMCTQLSAKSIEVVLDGGTLIVEKEDDSLYIIGDAKYNFYGEIDYNGKT